MGLAAYRAKQTTTTAGTGTLTLIAAPSNLRGFQAAFGASARVVRYVISNSTQYEIGIGTFDGGSPGTLTRTTILASSNAGSVVSLSAGTADVLGWFEPSERTLIESTSSSLTIAVADLGNAVIWTGTSAATVNLPALATCPPGSSIVIINGGSQAVTIDPNGSETVNGRTTMVLGPNGAVEIVSGTGGWRIAGGSWAASNIIDRNAASALTQLDLALTPGFSRYKLDLWDLQVSTTGQSLLLRKRIGGSFLAGATDYVRQHLYGVSTTPLTTNVSAAAIDLTGNLNGSDRRNQVLASIFPGAAGVLSSVLWSCGTLNNTPAWQVLGGFGGPGTAGLVTDVRLTVASGTFSCQYQLEGIA